MTQTREEAPGGDIQFISTSMKAIIDFYSNFYHPMGGDDTVGIQVMYIINGGANDGQVQETVFLELSGVTGTSDDDALEIASANAIVAYATTQGYGTTAADIDLGYKKPFVFSTPTRAVNTAYQPSTTRNAMVNASVDITSTLSLTTGQVGKVSLQYADNNTFTTNLVTVQAFSNGNSGSLTLGLNLGQIVTAAVSGIIPKGKYYRLLTTNVTGTPSYGTPVVQEVLL